MECGTSQSKLSVGVVNGSQTDSTLLGPIFAVLYLMDYPETVMTSSIFNSIFTT